MFAGKPVNDGRCIPRPPRHTSVSVLPRRLPHTCSRNDYQESQAEQVHDHQKAAQEKRQMYQSSQRQESFVRSCELIMRIILCSKKSMQSASPSTPRFDGIRLSPVPGLIQGRKKYYNWRISRQIVISATKYIKNYFEKCAGQLIDRSALDTFALKLEISRHTHSYFSSSFFLLNI